MIIEDKYISELDQQDIRWFDFLVKDKGSEVVALNSLLHDLDCTRVYKDGSRPVQTINYGYKRDIAGYIYIYNKFCEKYPDCNVDYYAKLVNRHEENLSFEKDNPPIYYKGQQRASSRGSRRTAEIADIFTGEKSKVDVGTGRIVRPRNNAETRKAKALSTKSVSFAFGNFKINK